MLANRKQRSRGRDVADKAAKEAKRRLTMLGLGKRVADTSSTVLSFNAGCSGEAAKDGRASVTPECSSPSSRVTGELSNAPTTAPAEMAAASPAHSPQLQGGQMSANQEKSFKGLRFSADEMQLEMINVGLWQRIPKTASSAQSAPPPPSKQASITTLELDDTVELLSSPLQNVNLTLAQGKMYAVCGCASSGKSSLLRLLGKAVHPSKGEVFVPPHLLIVHVEQEPQIIRHMSMFENLALGFKKTAPPLEHVCEVCDALGLSQRWISHLCAEHQAMQQQKLEVAKQKARVRKMSVSPAFTMKVETEHVLQSSWQNQLSATDKHLIQLARALITNPHVLVLHRPFASLDENVAENVLKALRRFITHRSLFSNNSPASLLSRTVIFSSSTADEQALQAADDVIIVGSPAGGASLLYGGGNGTDRALVDDGEGPGRSEMQRSLPEIVRHVCASTNAASIGTLPSRTSHAVCSKDAFDSDGSLGPSAASAIHRFTERQRVQRSLEAGVQQMSGWSVAARKMGLRQNNMLSAVERAEKFASQRDVRRLAVRRSDELFDLETLL